MVPYPQIFQCVFPKNKYIYITTVQSSTSGNLTLISTLISHLYSNFFQLTQSCPIGIDPGRARVSLMLCPLGASPRGIKHVARSKGWKHRLASMPPCDIKFQHLLLPPLLLMVVPVHYLCKSHLAVPQKDLGKILDVLLNSYEALGKGLTPLLWFSYL